MWRRLLSIFPVVILISLWFVIVYKNFSSGTWLTGWDNLHPEFNFPLNIERSLSAVWQEYQGVGLLGGMAHAADLPRLLILWPISLVLPAHLIRYFWTFLMLLVGPLGVYFLVGKWTRRLAGFVAAIFYLLNLATVQYFYTPYDAFVSFYGFLPWLILSAINYLRNPSKRNILFLVLISLLATAAFYVQTLFIVYLVILSAVALEMALAAGREGIKRLFAIYFLLFAINSFWLLPAAYFSLTNSRVVSLAHQNSIATPETQLYNEARGNLGDIALLKGYWFDYYDLGANNQFDYLYAPWIVHLDKPYVARVGYFIFGGAVLGIILNFFRRESPLRLSPILLLVLVYFMLATTNPPFGPIFSFVSGRIPLFGEVFRNVFTKWSAAAALIYSLGIACLFALLASIFGRKFLKLLVSSVIVVYVSALFYIVYPVFSGSLISSKMRIAIPDGYFLTMKYLNSQPQGRVAFLPLQSFWGWNFYNWGYRGSGFVWYGLSDPILDRAFDVWSSYNENFYKEASYALYANDRETFGDTLKKYEVGYLLLDESVINAGGSDKLLEIPKIKDMLSSLNMHEVEKFGFLTIYRTGFGSQSNFISAPVESFPDQLKEGPIRLNLPPSGAGAIVEESFGAGQGFSQAKNCDLKKDGGVSKSHIGSGILYRAWDGGVSCDYFYYPQLKYDQAYILRIKGENRAGRGLKIYLQNIETGRMDMEELLSAGAFDETFAILPKPNLVGDQGYTLNIETRSFGKIPSENIIEAIEFYPVDSNSLSTFKGDSLQVFDPEDFGGERSVESAQTRRGEYSIQNNSEILNVQKFGTWLYKVDTQGDGPGGLIELGQGYDEGWVAFTMINGKWPMANKLQHVKVDSWSNGWLVRDEGFQPPTSNLQLLIFYWPQLLEYLGFFVLVGTLTLVLTKR